MSRQELEFAFDEAVQRYFELSEKRATIRGESLELMCMHLHNYRTELQSTVQYMRDRATSRPPTILIRPTEDIEQTVAQLDKLLAEADW